MFSGWNFKFNAKKRERLQLAFDNKEVAAFEADGTLVVDSIKTKSSNDYASPTTLGNTQNVTLLNESISIQTGVTEIENPNSELALTQITGGKENQLLVLRKAKETADFIVQSGKNLYLNKPFEIHTDNDRLTLIKNGLNSYELSRITSPSK